jgi:hypothetical protein
MEGGRFLSMDPRETYVPLALEGFGDLIDGLLRSGLWKEHSVVSACATSVL